MTKVFERIGAILDRALERERRADRLDALERRLAALEAGGASAPPAGAFADGTLFADREGWVEAAGDDRGAAPGPGKGRGPLHPLS